jgi:hypothetical protein
LDIFLLHYPFIYEVYNVFKAYTVNISTTLRVYLVGLWLLEKLLRVVGCGKAVVEDRLVRVAVSCEKLYAVGEIPVIPADDLWDCI